MKKNEEDNRRRDRSKNAKRCKSIDGENITDQFIEKRTKQERIRLLKDGKHEHCKFRA